MKGSLLISIAVLTVACGGGSRSDDGAMNERAGQPPASAQATSDANAPVESEQTVTLVGCLAGPAAPPAGATGTAGTPNQPPAAVGTQLVTERFLLKDAIAEQAGVGTSGAGASGGPLVSGKSTFALDDIPNGAREDVNKQVRIIGQLEARPAKVGTSPVTGEEYRRLTVQSVEVIAPACEQQ